MPRYPIVMLTSATQLKRKTLYGSLDTSSSSEQQHRVTTAGKRSSAALESVRGSDAKHHVEVWTSGAASSQLPETTAQPIRSRAVAY
jgi:hypothetical protein